MIIIQHTGMKFNGFFTQIRNLHPKLRSIEKKLPEYAVFRIFREFTSHRSDRIRTCGILVPNQALYQLSHTPPFFFAANMISHFNLFVNDFKNLNHITLKDEI